MIAQNLLEKIGFSIDDIKDYQYYRSIINDKIEKAAYDYMFSDVELKDILGYMSEFETDEIHMYTARLMFILECTGYLEQLYKDNNISMDIFVNSMKDIKYKLDECRKVHNVFGTFVVEWYNGFFRMRRFALGRLQYDLCTHTGDSINVMGYTLNDGDFYLGCHIPSSGPLLPEKIEESFAMAYEMYKDRLDGKPLFISCGTYLFYPPYQNVFGEDSNTVKFAKNFHIVKVMEGKSFSDAWRIFGEDYKGSTKGLKNETSLQRRFISYLDNNPTFGVAVGYAVFDGKNIITKR